MLKENKNAFLNNSIDKFQYMEQMFAAHKILYEYAGFISHSHVLDITIKDGTVYFNFLNNGMRITMVSVPYDITSVPFTFLDFDAYELKENTFLMDSIHENDVVLDIGANVGWFSIQWLKKVKNVTVFSFEPISVLFDTLVKNLVLNGQEIKNAFNYGLSNSNDTVDFFFDTERCGASSMVDLRDSGKTVPQKCTVKRLDDVFPTFGIDRLDFIKCDVEGAEKLVYEGGIETIKRHTPIIFSEMLRKWSKKFNYHPNDIINLLTGINYKCFIARNKTLQEISRVTEDTIETNFIFLHVKNHAELIHSQKGF